MSQDAQSGSVTLKTTGRDVIVPDRPSRPALEQEIDIIRRTLFNVLDRLDRLKKSELKTT